MVENQEKQGVVDPPMAENQGWPTHIEHRVGCIWPTHPWQGSGWPRSPREPTSSDLFLWCYLGHTKPPHHHDTSPKIDQIKVAQGLKMSDMYHQSQSDTWQLTWTPWQLTWTTHQVGKNMRPCPTAKKQSKASNRAAQPTLSRRKGLANPSWTGSGVWPIDPPCHLFQLPNMGNLWNCGETSHS